MIFFFLINMKKLNELIDTKLDIDISSIETDSRLVKKGTLFVAVKGKFTNHEDFIDSAIEKGASCIVASKTYDKDVSVPIIKVDDINECLFSLLDNFYDNIMSRMYIVGITGTDGKTTSAFLTAKITDSAYIGTNGVFYKDYKSHSSNTTPEPVELYKIFNDLCNKGARKVIMEVSSESLLYDRCHSMRFSIAGLTNVTEDHLNIHRTLENYIKCKEKLFTQVKDDGVSILNADSKYFDNFKKISKGKIVTYGMDADYSITNINLSNNSFDLKYKDNIYSIKSQFPFIYNMYNITLAFIIGTCMGLDSDTLVKNISSIKSIDGRSEVLDFGQDYTIMLDYAHTLNAIKNLVLSVKDKYKKVFVITGAAGGREKEKRCKIGNFLLSNTYLTIFTMDDPRFESVDSIIDDMISRSTSKNYLRINDRKDAIYKGLSLCKKSDVILIIGKGRDNYMYIEDKKIPYSDYDVIKNYFDK